MQEIKRAVVIVLDSVGAGYLPDAADFGDYGANTLGHIAGYVGGLNLPNMQRLGLGNIIPIKGVSPVKAPTACWGLMSEASLGKDTMAGHWEMMGLVVEKAFPVFPGGFPVEIMEEFYQAAGVTGALGNKPASGTAIIVELGEEHIRTGLPIVYTSADSVFQIAAHEEIIPLDRLYRMCEAARKVCDRYQVGRVIARPFIGSLTGKPDRFTRTVNRKDYPLVPWSATALDFLKANHYPVCGIGKIEDIFAGQGITRAIHTKSNSDGMDVLSTEMGISRKGLIFVNLVDFDMLYGHRNDAANYARALEEFDKRLGELLQQVEQDDMLIITADHGCDPTFPGTDHTREYVPLLLYSPCIQPRALGIRKTFSDIAVTLLQVFKIPHSFPGESLLQ